MQRSQFQRMRERCRDHAVCVFLATGVWFMLHKLSITAAAPAFLITPIDFIPIIIQMMISGLLVIDVYEAWRARRVFQAAATGRRLANAARRAAALSQADPSAR